MLTIYLYPNSIPHLHDTVEEYKNIVPFSLGIINNYCKITNDPLNCDYFYIGQWHDQITPDFRQFPYLDKYPEKHIIDIEGDGTNRNIPNSLFSSILTINSLNKGLLSLLKKKPYVRPTFSKLLVDCAKNRYDRFTLGKRSFGFIGLSDPWGVRHRMAKILNNLNINKEIILRNDWNGLTHKDSPIVKKYEELMMRNSFALCPRGAGEDSVRFYEACFFERVPVIIGNNILPGELDGYDVSFAFRINYDESEQNQMTKFLQIYSISDDEILERSIRARKYFEDIIRPQIQKPTERFIKWLT